MGFNLTDFSPLQASLHDIGSDVPTPDFSAAVEKSQQAVSQSVSLVQEVQPKKVLASPLESCQYHLAQVQDVMPMDKSKLFLSISDLKNKTASQISALADQSQQQLVDYHKIENRCPSVYHLQQLKSSLINLKDRHQVPGDTNSAAFDQLQQNVNGIAGTLSQLYGSTQSTMSDLVNSSGLPDKLPDFELPTADLSTAMGVNVPTDLIPESLFQFDSVSSLSSLQEKSAVFFGYGDHIANDFSSEGVSATSQKGNDDSEGVSVAQSAALFLGYQGSHARQVLSDQLSQQVACAEQSLSDIAANQGAVLKNTQNLLAMQSFLNAHSSQVGAASLDQLKTDQLAQLSAMVDEQHQHFLSEYQNYNPYPQEKIDEAMSQMTEDNSFVRLASQTQQLDLQAEAWNQCSQCSDFSVADFTTMQASAASFMNLGEQMTQMGYSQFDAVANSVANYQQTLNNYQSSALANYAGQKDQLMQSALASYSQLTNLQSSLSDPEAIMAASGINAPDLSAYEDQFADLAATQAALQAQLDQVMENNSVLDASTAMTNNIEMSVCGLALPPLLDMDFSLPDFSLGLSSINLMKLSELADLLKKMLASFLGSSDGSGLFSINLDFINNILNKISDIKNKMSDWASGIVDQFMGQASGLFDFALPNLSDMLNGLMDKLNGLWSKFSLCSTISSALASLISAVSGLADQFKDALSMDNIMGSLDQLKSTLSNLLGGSGNSFLLDIIGLYNDALAKLSELTDAYQSLKSLALDQYATGLAKLQGLTDQALAAYQSLKDTLNGYIPVVPAIDMDSLMAYFPGLEQLVNDINEAIACLTSSFSSFAASAEGDQIGVASGAQVKCDKGLAEMPLNVIPLGKEYGPGKSMTVMLNVIPYLNIPSFGACMSSSNPLAIANFGILPTTCMPIVMPFFPVAMLTQAMSLPLATNESQCYCIFSMLTSTLTIADPGQDEMKVT
ncbi:hypothetical protein AVI51_01535 [Piscirickettsia salmonis]|uniref:DUF4280 domain-containing protein n=1 Tax=Piscirickettsia salmonis TaxID=1238 RepID=UPI0002D7D1BF|nr:PAAR-like protein [Piscirickettsia salmonis]WGZ70649.1 DUF4280 domain-containing protein [Piscirickettsia salmonis EM-90]ALA24741.1 hypothetical protein KW89_1273 [Piscirickettsia salmonis]APS45071.1 hypothetical protein AVI48_12265 [Piscirickettsia salmonis]APS48431.1 hypothetical protein AVI49_12875 [Piscirickettsia salmonis]APS49689.1 hypothetical protein AVI50_01575 [Piscirickettsia salmonis]